ncbi:MAG: hypothetical protein OIF50_11240 [Flavobacteriaceae bacterium]|nr:hypothetical protein [Flavobacteriaceae bacterium]
MKHVWINLIAVLQFFIIYSQNKVHIKVPQADVIILDENYFEKREDKTSIHFDFGLETLGEVNRFTHKKDQMLQTYLSSCTYRSLSFHKVKELPEIVKNSSTKIYIVEKTIKGYVKYRVHWNRIIYKE